MPEIHREGALVFQLVTDGSRPYFRVRSPGHPFLWVNIETMEADPNDRFPETMKTTVMQWARPRQAVLAEAWLKAKAGMKVGRIP